MALPGLSRVARGVFAALAVALLLTEAAGCASKKVYREGTPMITGAAGDSVTVELASNPTTGYSWMLVGQPDPQVVALMEADFTPGPSTTLGAGGHQHWTFRLVSRGSTTITFSYGRTWENSPAEKATMFTVVVK